MSITPVNKSVLVVDDDDDIRYAICNILKKCGCTVAEAVSVEAALQELSEQRFDIVFSDMRFHGGAGGEALLEFTNQNLPEIDVVLISCAMESDRKKELIEKGASMCLQKPFFKDTCIDVLEQLAARGRKAA